MCTQTALRLTEVLRERDAQLEFKKKKASMYKNLDEQYVKMQHEVSTYHNYNLGSE